MNILKGNITIIEPYELLNGTYSITLPQYRLFQYVVGECYVKDKLDKDVFYNVNIGKYAEFFECTHKEAYDNLTTAMRKGNIPIIDLPESAFTKEAKPSKRRQFILYNSFIYDIDSSTIMVRLAPEIIELYNRLDEEGRWYAKYILAHTKHMKSINSIRLFRLMNKWRSTKDWTNYGTVHLELNEFKRLMGFKETEYKKWADLYRYVIMPSIADIHKESFLEVKFEPRKLGRKVIGLTFSVLNKKKVFK